MRTLALGVTLSLLVLSGCKSEPSAKCPPDYKSDEPPVCMKLPADFKPLEVQNKMADGGGQRLFTNGKDQINFIWNTMMKDVESELKNALEQEKGNKGTVIAQGELPQKKGKWIVVRNDGWGQTSARSWAKSGKFVVSCSVTAYGKAEDPQPPTFDACKLMVPN
jgi:hypothetical protein